jgi:hypothetical protein
VHQINHETRNHHDLLWPWRTTTRSSATGRAGITGHAG